ncbi:molybdopterin-dependent oxidoreductase [Pseudonocardia sp. KRD-184]|uniref:Molybdopterin-dependent oxidoreductase n=1 Tax=Pseudonocardia oceani TaxID=2792013 RepID=A0ABS6U2E8_9PSEU|nr:molybdopterin cofactor-binding domain-containing protein [Pseudonocardia oceani]MBW0093080.1 molybdopterin-dependent oxidoreductase [Pseudonocardia oceani]MBW0099868.1 molybdopterin-dependent oxidoreductase [Pseudonocardia oceani]MBW0112526.1 molybdopterin-dependent oxidoreductase [Pseudonocardia oceani]MBW0125701.1 molybdopterin-dependent oxidoreductase [Pseudonocardia oceani]MBW0126133.1 molybdopterin-dependent oxidoreductase [Pseudonocardia oceani]
MSVGDRVRPIDWDARSTGLVAFTADLPGDHRRGDHLHGAILRSPHPHAAITALDTSAARALPGVHAVITAADFAPGIRYLHRGGPLSDRPPLADGVVRHVGQEVAAVAAETPEQAAAALRAIRVRYRRLRAPLTVTASRAPGAPRLHERTTAEPNVSMLLRTDWGDPDAGLAAAAVTVEGRFVHPSVAHACMEPSTTLAAWDAGRGVVELWTSTQAPWFIAKEVSHLLGLEHDQVVCREVAVGGGFGQKSKAAEHEVLAAALSRAAGRPVLVELSREEEFAANKPRHRFETVLRTSADADGLLRALEADVVVDNGSYNHMGTSVMRVGVITLGSMYRPDGVRFAARLVDTATQPGGQFRGYGTPQVSLAMEQQVDEVAARLGVDPIELRLRNLAPEHARALCGYEVTTSRLGDCLVAVREGLDWERARAARPVGPVARGWGVAAGTHGSGAYAYEHADRSDAAVDLFADGRARVRYGGTDAGTGQSTILAQIAAQELGLDLADVAVLSTDSERTPFELGAWSSRGTHMTGSSVGLAARELADRLRALAAEKLGVDADAVRLSGGRAVAGDDAVDLGDLVGLADDAVDGVLSHESSYRVEGTEMLTPDRDTANLSPTYAFAAHGAVVEVDRRTGKVRVVDYLAAHDVGRALNPTAVEGQIVGGAAMGLGAALGEELVREGGRVVTSSYLHYAMPRSADLPSIRAVVVDAHDAAGPYGAKSVGEMSIIPPGAAVANAVFDAVGVRIRELPITPDKVLSALAAQEGRTRDHRIRFRPGRWWVAAIRWFYPRGLHHVLDTYGTRLGRAHRARSRLPAPEPVLHAPTGLDEALTLLATPGAAPLGGATDAPVERRRETRPAPVLVSVAAVTGLRPISRTPAGLRIGAAATLAELAAHPDAPPALAAAVATIASPQVRAAATVGGNLVQAKRCWFFRNGFDCYKRSGATSPCYAVLGDHRFQHAVVDGHRCQAVTPSDLATVLVALDASVEVDGGRTLPIGEFYTGPGETVLRDGELVTAVTVPEAALRRHTAFTKLALYTGDFATASVALAVDRDPDGAWRDARIVLGAMAPVPLRMVAAEAEVRAAGAVTPGVLRRAVDRELERTAHPLAGNAWKVDAAAGLAEQAAEQLATPRALDAVRRAVHSTTTTA